MTGLLGNRVRKKILVYLFTHVGESFYVRQLSGLIGEDAGNLSRELRKLEEGGLCLSSRKGREKFYCLSKGYPLFSELKAIVSKTEGVEAGLKDIVSAHKGISLALLHGSYAKNKEKAGSDIDVIIVGKILRGRFTDDIRRLEAQLNRQINFTTFSEAEFETERRKEGSFLKLVLKDKFITLKGRLNV